MPDDDEPVWQNKELRRDLELEKIIGSLLVPENQENKLERIFADRIDPYNLVAFSKEYSEHVFKHEGKSYRISVKVDKVDIKKEKRTLFQQMQMLLPAFGITASLFLAAFLTISVNDVYFNGRAKVAAFLANDEYIAQILEKCGSLVNWENPHPRLSIALYAACDKQIKQIQEFCEIHYTNMCTDERIDKYLMARKLL